MVKRWPSCDVVAADARLGATFDACGMQLEYVHDYGNGAVRIGGISEDGNVVLDSRRTADLRHSNSWSWVRDNSPHDAPAGPTYPANCGGHDRTGAAHSVVGRNPGGLAPMCRLATIGLRPVEH
jgi:hypothetical protein